MKKQPNQFIIKKFYKNKAVITIMHFPNKRVKILWAIPDGDLVKIHGGVYQCDASKQDTYSILNGVPVFTYYHNKVEALKVNGDKSSLMTASEYNTAIDNKVVQEIFLASNKKMDLISAIIMGGIALIIVMAIGFYFLFDKVGSLQTLINDLKTYIETISGGVSVG